MAIENGKKKKAFPYLSEDLVWVGRIYGRWRVQEPDFFFLR